MQKKLKIIFISFSIILFLIAQLFFLKFNNLSITIILTLLSFLFIFCIFFDNEISNFLSKTLILFKKNEQLDKNLKTNKKENVISKLNINTINNLIFKKIRSKSSEGINTKQSELKKNLIINIKISKLILIVLSILFIFIAQYFVFENKFNLFFIFVILSIILSTYYFIIKDNFLILKLNFEKGIKLLSFLSGFILLIIGWIFLIKNNIRMQEIGVGITTVGVILAFLGLPENEARKYTDTPINEFIFNSGFFNNYFVKIFLILMMFVFFKIGNLFISSNDNSLVSIFMYLIAFIFLFFALPFNNNSLNLNSKLTNIIRLIFVLISFYIAYKAQILFTKNNVLNAVKLYFISAFILVLAIPVNIPKNANENNIPKFIEFIFLLFILFVAIYFRFYEIDVRPLGFENDEAGGFLDNYLAVKKNIVNHAVGNRGLQFNITDFFIYIFKGWNRTIIKLPSLVVGTIFIFVIYFFIRRTISVESAMFVTIIAAVLRWHVHYSRSAHPMHFAVLAFAAALFFIYLAITKKDKLSFFLSGLFSGFSWHFVLTAWISAVPFFVYFFIKIITEKNFFNKNFNGIIAFFLGFWIFTSMIIHNYFISNRIYFARIQEVSVFSKDPNAPKNPGKGIIENTKNVLLMFNHMGDSRQRNSGGQPYEPTIDFTSAIFFGIGFIYCMYYSKYFLYFIIVMLFFSQAAGSIFSIEAPSAMRAIGTMTSMIFFIAVTFNILWISFKNVLPKKISNYIILPVLLFVPLFFIVKDNYNQYFKRWIGGLDELSTVAGMYAKELGENYRINLCTSTYYPGHPPFKIYKMDEKAHSSNCPINIIHYMTLINNENYAVFFHYDTNEYLSYWLRKFPEAKYNEITHSHFNKKLKEGEGFGKFFDSVEISNEQIKNIQNLKGIYKNKSGIFAIIEKDLPELTNKFDDKLPYEVNWDGQIFIPFYGDVSFNKTGAADVKLFINDIKIEFNNFYRISRGIHNVKIIAVKNQLSNNFNLNFKIKEAKRFNIIFSDNLTRGYFYHKNFMSEGLLGKYYTSFVWDDDTIESEEINPYIYFHSGHIASYNSFKWSGYINITENNYYNFSANASGYLRYVIDNKYYFEMGALGDNKKAIDYFAGKNLQYAGDFVYLTKGLHKIEVYGIKTNAIKLYMKTKDNPILTLIQPEILIPDRYVLKISN